MSFYANLLSAANNRLGYIADDPDRSDNNVDWKLSFAAKPKKNIDLNLEKKMECSVKAGKDGATASCEQIEKTVTTLKHNHGKCTTKYTFANDKFAFEAKGNAVNDDGWKVDVTGAAECKPAKKEWKTTGKLDITTPDMGGAKAAINVSADYNQKGDICVKPNANFEISNEFNLGVAAKWDTKTFQEIWPQLVYKPADNKDSLYWARADLTRSNFRAGCDQQIKDGINHSFELVYGWKDFAGLMGKPVAILTGVEYELSKQTSFAASATFGSDIDIENEVEHQVDDHWTVSAKQTFCSSAEHGCSPYHIGFTASYKL